jgi:hypothetical protein
MCLTRAKGRYDAQRGGDSMTRALAILLVVSLAHVAARDPQSRESDRMAPQTVITNGQITAKLYLPDAKTGFYRGTRFDWAGVIFSLQYGGHEYYGPWFTQQDPAVRDFIYKDQDIVVGAASGVTGPAEDFRPLRYDTAKTGETFIKIGVGVLKKPDDTNYSPYRAYDIVDPGVWTVKTGPASVEFTHQLRDPASGYAYEYRKVVRLAGNEPEMVLEHSLKNIGQSPIATNVYDHNFLVLDRLPPGPGVEISFPFDIKTSRPPDAAMAEVRGNKIVYLKRLENEDRVTFPIQGFGSDAKDYDIRIEQRTIGAGMRITCDRPLSSMSLWSIRSTLSVEPFIAVSVEPGQEFTWKYTYTYYTIAK